MIGSGNISSYGSHAHNHAVTQCLHETHVGKAKGGAAMAGGGPGAAQEVQGEETFSLKGLWPDGWKSLASKTAGFFGSLWNSGEAGKVAEGKETPSLWQDARHQAQGTAAADSVAVTAAAEAGSVPVAAAVPAGRVPGAAAADRVPDAVAAAVVRAQGEGKGNPAGTDAEAGKEAGSRVNGTETATGGGYRRGREEVRGFLRKFGRAAAGVKRAWDWKGEGKQEAETSPAKGNPEDFTVGNSSYLLDSYNRSGEYSTLANDRSLEGSFRARG